MANPWTLAVGAFCGALLASLGLVYGPLLISKPVDLDESDPQRTAAISVSDPLLYARETLINDRRDEFEYLSKLLADSANPEKVQFAPQVIRDMSVLSALTGQASVQLAGGGDPPKANPDMPKPLPLPQQGTNGGTLPADTSGATAKTGATKPSTSPQEEFRDRQAYRGDLRAALASVNLDDLHDLAGNALFRLQFKVATFPGEIKNKFGVAQLTVRPPSLKAKDLTAIYRVWLGHTSSRLNQFVTSGNLIGDPQFNTSAMAPYMKLIKLGVSTTRSSNGEKDPCMSLTPADLDFAKRNSGLLGGQIYSC